jgi:hypothetical protein
MRTLFDDGYRIELSLRFPRLRVNSQIATDLAVRESVFIIFNDVFHFSDALFLYIQVTGQDDFRSKLMNRFDKSLIP